jgi:hypothetical protein
MRKRAAAPRAARAGTGSSTMSRTPRKAKTAAPTTPKTRATTARAGTRATSATRAKTQTTPKAATATIKGTRQATTARRGQPVRAREVGGTPWQELRTSLVTAFENAFADRKGQARGAAMRGPNRILADLDKHIQAITRQTMARQTQVQKLMEEMAQLRQQLQGGGQMNRLEEGRRTEHTAPDQIAGQRGSETPPAGGPEAAQEAAHTGGDFGVTEQGGTRRTPRIRGHQTASAD